MSDGVTAPLDQPDEETEPTERFKVDSLDTADWAFRKILERQAEVETYREFVKAERNRLDEYLVEVCTPLLNDVEYFEGLLREWASQQTLAEFAEVQDWAKVKHKSFKLPHGKVSARRSAAGSFTLLDRDLAIRGAEAVGRDDLIYVTALVRATELDRAVDLGTARVDALGGYEVVDVEGEWVGLPGVKREGVGQITFKVETS